MSRLQLEKNIQKDFLYKIQREKGLSWKKIAQICNVCERTIRDWSKEKFKMNYDALTKLVKITNISSPKILSILPEFWNVKDAAKKGGIIRRNKYGSLGTLESRKKGGFKTQEKFRLDPGFAKKAGAIVRKEINYSNNPELLAEFIGILLGDGGITNYQVKITFNCDTDRLYSKFIQDTIKRLFNISSSIIKRTSDKGNDVFVSSRNLVEFLLDKGLKTGSKIRNHADIPKWIYKRYEYKIGCIRGLIDTDGSFYLYEPTVNNKAYLHFAMCFTNHSRTLLNSVYCLLRELGFKPVKTEKRIYLYRNADIMRYFDIISSNNPKHYNKYKQYIKDKKLSKVPQARDRK